MVDARTATSGCGDGVTLHGMTVQLGADLVICADRLSMINRLTVQSRHGQPHELRILVPDSSTTQSESASVVVADGIQADAQTNVQIVTSGRIEVNGLAATNGQVQAGRFASSGLVTLDRATLTAKDTM